MKIEKFFKLSIGDTILELTSKKLRDIATMDIKPTYTVMIDEKSFDLSEQGYKSLKATASTALSIVPKPKKRGPSLSNETRAKIFDGVIDDWRTIQEVMDATGHNYKNVSAVLKQLHDESRIDRRKHPSQGKGNKLQYKLKTRDYVPEHNEVAKIETSDESFDYSALDEDRRKRMIAQRER